MTVLHRGIFYVLIILNSSCALFSLIAKLSLNIIKMSVQIPKHTELTLLKYRTQIMRIKTKFNEV